MKNGQLILMFLSVNCFIIQPVDEFAKSTDYTYIVLTTTNSTALNHLLIAMTSNKFSLL